jgi:hypothetical protein
VVVDVFVEVNVNVPVRVCATVAVSRGCLLVVNVTRILGDAVVVAVCVFVARRLLLGVDVEVGVLLCIADRVDEKVFGIVSVVFDVFDWVGLAVVVFDTGLEREKLGDAEDVFDVRCEGVVVGLAEFVLDVVGDAEIVFVDVIVLEDVVDAVRVCV